MTEEISRQGNVQAEARLLLPARIQVHGEREQEVEQKEMKRVTSGEEKHRSEYSLANKTDSKAALTLKEVSAIKGRPVILFWNHRKDVLKEKCIH